MHYPLVSIITPVYNGSSYLDHAVQSVLNQTYQNWELFLVDDGSCDDSYEKAVNWSKKDKRIIALNHPNHENRGVCATRNLAIHHAKGEYIATLDCDDEWLPEKLEKQINIMIQHPETVMTYCQAEMIDEKGAAIASDPQKLANSPYPAVAGLGIHGCAYDNFEPMMGSKKIWAPCSTVLARAEDVRKCGGFDETLEYQIEDSLLATLLFDMGSIFFINEVLARYRFHSNSWTSKLDSLKHGYRIYLEYYEKLFEKVKPEHRFICSQELADKWIHYFGRVTYWRPLKDNIHISLSFYRILLQRNVTFTDKARCFWVLMKWIIRKFILFPFKRLN